MTDVVFVTRDDDMDPSPPPLVAHRSFLAVLSDFFSDSFCGEFSEAEDASSSNPIQFPAKKTEEDYYSARCVQLLLNHIYIGDEPPEDTPLVDLLDAMELSGYWRLGHFFEEIQRTIIKRRLVNPSSLDYIRETAKEANAEVLFDQCQEYEAKNVEYIRKVQSRSQHLLPS